MASRPSSGALNGSTWYVASSVNSSAARFASIVSHARRYVSMTSEIGICSLRTAFTSGIASPQQPLERVVYELRVCLAARRAHHLAHEELEDAFVARTVFCHVVRVLLDDLTARPLDLARVRDLREPLGRDDATRRLAGLKHCGEYLLPDRAGDLRALDEYQQLGEGRG